MRHKLFLVGTVILTVAVFTLVLFSYATLGNQVAQNESRIVTVRVETDKASYLKGDVVNIRTFLTNVGNETIKTYGMTIDYKYFDPKGGFLIGVTQYCTYPGENPLVITPQNETVLPPAEWNQCYFVDGEGSISDVQLATAGTYRVEVTISLEGFTLNETPRGELVTFSEASFNITGDSNTKLLISSLVVVLLVAVVTLAVVRPYRERGKSKC